MSRVGGIALILVLALLVTPTRAEEVRKPLKVFILAGQSNMQGHAQTRTFAAMAMDPGSTDLLAKLRAENGTPRVCDDVWISYLSSNGVKEGRLTAGFGASDDKIGPEFAFGMTMHERLGEPILVIKTAWGGKSLHTDFRPPSAGPYVFTEAQKKEIEKRHAEKGDKDFEAVRAEKEKATGQFYRLMAEHVKQVLADPSRVVPDYDPKWGYELAGFVWFQGWNDMVDGGVYPDRAKPGGYDLYSELLVHFIRDVRKEFGAPKMPFVIGVMGVGGPTSEYGPEAQRYKSTHQNFRDAMAAPAAKGGRRARVTAVLTEKYWDGELAKIRARDKKLRRAIEKRRKAGEITREEERAEIEAQRAKEFDDRERALLEKGISNAEFHYLGSAKILSNIGRAFAEALTKD